MDGNKLEWNRDITYTLPVIMLHISLLFVIDDLPLGVFTTKFFFLYIFTLFGSLVLGYMIFTQRISASEIDIVVLLILFYLVFFNFEDIIRGMDNKKFVVFVNSITIYFSIRLLRFSNASELNYLLVLSSMFVFAVCSCVFVLLQKLHIAPSYNLNFDITGTFFHPAPLAGYLACILPLSSYSYYVLKFRSHDNYGLTLKYIRGLSLITSCSILVILPSLGSRSATIGALAGIAFVFFPSLKNNFYKLTRSMKIVSISAMLIAICFLSIGIYNIRPESVNGRILVWKIAARVIADNPVFGHGLDSFKKIYPDYQINFFKHGLNNRSDIALSDEVTMAFNEPIQMFCETGIIGVILFMLVLIKVFRSDSLYLGQGKTASEALNTGLKAALCSFTVFSFFSYPFAIVELTVLFFVLLGIVNPPKRQFQRRNIQLPFKISLLSICLFVIFLSTYMFEQYQGYKEWHLGMNSRDDMAAHKHFEEADKFLNGNGVFVSSFARFYKDQGNTRGAIHLLERKTGKTYGDIMLIAECYEELCDESHSLQYYITAHYLLPHRFMPLAKQLHFYEKSKNPKMIKETATKIIDMDIKIHSREVDSIRNHAMQKLNLFL